MLEMRALTAAAEHIHLTPAPMGSKLPYHEIMKNPSVFLITWISFL